MAQVIRGGGESGTGLKMREEKLNKKIMLEDVEIRTKVVEIQVPRFVDRVVEVAKFIPKEIEVVDVKVKEKDVETQTVVVKENVVEVDKPSYKEVVVEVPKFVPREVIDCVIKEVEKEVEVLKVVEKIKVVEVPVEVKTFKLVEEIIKVPRIQYVPTEVERVVWKDVPRDRCSNCGRPV